MATNRPQGDLFRWRINTTLFWLGKPLKFLPWIRNPILLMPAVGFEPTILITWPLRTVQKRDKAGQTLIRALY